MSIFGKVLIFFNLLAAGAFTYLTVQDWKLRQELQWAKFRGDSLLGGLPVEPPGTAAGKLDDDRVAFSKTAGGIEYTSLPKTRLAEICPPGDGAFGGPAVASQTDEVKRLQTKLFAESDPPMIPKIEANNGVDRLNRLQGYLLNLARSGADRDGVKALLDVYDPSKREKARRDLAFLARTPSQVEALRTMVDVLDLGDPQAVADEAARASRIINAREAVKRFALGEVAHGGGDAAELDRRMKNLLANPNDAGKAEVKAAAPAAGFEHVVDVAANPLTTKAQADAAVVSLAAYATAKVPANAPEAKKALDGVIVLVKKPAGVAYTAAEVDAAATPLLAAYFEDAAAPVSKDAGSDSYGGKARKIAHLLYHIDAHRHLSAQPTDVTDRQAWHQRVAWVVGLPTYVQVAEAQASEYKEAGERLIALITDEETAFRDQYNALVQRVRVLHSRWETLDAEARAQSAIKDENVRLKGERLTERDKLKEELAQAEIKAKEALDRLLETQKGLYTIQKQLRDAQEAILALERELRRRELGE